MHLHILGGSGFGKSKFIEGECRTLFPRPFAVLDWHGTLYRALLSFFAYLRPRRKLYLLDPTQDQWVAGFNPFIETGVDPTVQVNRRIASILKPWGGDRNDMPTFERMMRMVFTFAVEHKASLPIAAKLLEYGNAPLRRWVSENTADPYIRTQWEMLLEITTFREWETRVLSSENRISRFIGSKTIRRQFTIPNSLNISRIMDEEACLLINLQDTDYVDREAARSIAALILAEFYESAMRRAGTKKHYTLILDECQNYLTEDIPQMLTQTRKGGLSVWLSHQDLSQITAYKDSILSIPSRYVFGGLNHAHSDAIARELGIDKELVRNLKERDFLSKLNGIVMLDRSKEVRDITLSERYLNLYVNEVVADYAVSGKQADDEYDRQVEELFGRIKIRRLTKSSKVSK